MSILNKQGPNCYQKEVRLDGTRDLLVCSRDHLEASEADIVLEQEGLCDFKMQFVFTHLVKPTETSGSGFAY